MKGGLVYKDNELTSSPHFFTSLDSLTPRTLFFGLHATPVDTLRLTCSPPPELASHRSSGEANLSLNLLIYKKNENKTN
jgi:hypothetical protein